MTLDMEREMAAKHLTTHPIENHRDGLFYAAMTLIGALLIVAMIVGLNALLPRPVSKYVNEPAEKVETHYVTTDAGNEIGIRMTEGYRAFLKQVCAERPEASGCN